ncbi:hypothetical protein L6Q96_05145 [Candidatus Binatia bacterium]|nr:hypothetical protein [Candidatus Binatia bacterium]
MIAEPNRADLHMLLALIESPGQQATPDALVERVKELPAFDDDAFEKYGRQVHNRQRN